MWNIMISFTLFFKRFCRNACGVFMLFIFGFQTAIAQPAGTSRLGLQNPIKYPDMVTFLMALLNIVVQYGALLVVFFLVYTGFKFVTAQGNTEKIQDAKKMLVWVVVGAFVILGVFVIKAAICGTLQQISADPTKPLCAP